jgi:hypothetical protein
MHAGAVGVPTANGRRRGYDPPVTTRSGAIAGATASAPSSSARPRPSATRPSATWPRAWRPSALWVSLSWRHPGRTLSGAELTRTAVRSAAPEIVSQGSRGRGSMYVGCLHSGPGFRRWRHPPLFRVTPDPPCQVNHDAVGGADRIGHVSDGRNASEGVIHKGAHVTLLRIRRNAPRDLLWRGCRSLVRPKRELGQQLADPAARPGDDLLAWAVHEHLVHKTSDLTHLHHPQSAQ